ncbi:MAG: hypothetical protein O8C66_00290 [Candidatus Methanoperedens sp.]|nr:hypothetical protein [Candidatus Methanoperedens sp.]MCZ7368929.1 hypothetical protein [Candidatus Methanoperedens sp.]
MLRATMTASGLISTPTGRQEFAFHQSFLKKCGILEKKPQMKAPRVTSLPSRASGGRVHVCLQGIRVVWESRTVRFRSENPQGFGMMNADLLLHRR